MFKCDVWCFPEKPSRPPWIVVAPLQKDTADSAVSVHQEPTSTALSSFVSAPYRRAGLETTEQEEKDSDSESQEARSVEGT